MEKARQRDPNEQPHLGKKRIVIVDDHAIVRRGLVAVIDKEVDLKVVGEAEDFHEALDQIKDQQPDLVVVDLSLKDVGGLELIKQLKTMYPNLPALVLSMHDEKIYAERALRAGAKGYVMKQDESRELLAAIRTVLRGGIAISEDMSSRMLKRFVGGRERISESPVESLTDRELEIFQLIGQGEGVRDIADRLSVSVKTVEAHREHIKSKLDIRSAPELVRYATQWMLEEGKA